MPDFNQHGTEGKPFKKGDLNSKQQAIPSQNLEVNSIPAQPYSVPSETSIQFLLAEYNSLNDLLKHTNERLTATINLFLTMVTVVISGTVFLTQSSPDLQLLIVLLIPVSLLLATAGTFLSYRMIRTRVLKAEYIYALNLIRTFFVDMDSFIYPYLFLPVENSKSSSLGKRFNQRQGFKDYLNFIHLCTGVFAGFPVVAGIWIFYSGFPIWVLILLGGVMSGFFVYWLNGQAQVLSRKLKAELEDRRQQIGRV